MSTKEEEAKKGKGKGKSKEVAAVEVMKTLRVDVHFPKISDLKQAISLDTDGRLFIKIQFTAPVDQFELFRLSNLLNQPHGALYATIGSPQSAMDFKFTEDGRVEILKAQVKAEKAMAKTAALADPPAAVNWKVAKVHNTTFNHIPEDPRPYGVMIEFAVEGSGELKTAAGRGKDPTQAVISGARNCGIVTADIMEPFEIRAALEALEPSPANYKLIRVIDVGTFEIEPGGEDTEKKGG